MSLIFPTLGLFKIVAPNFIILDSVFLCGLSESAILSFPVDITLYLVKVILVMSALCEINNPDTNTNTGVPGRLLGCTEIYLEARAERYILETIDQGYKLMFIDNGPPSSFHRRNNISVLAQSEFVLAELLQLETLGCIRRVDYVPHIVNPLTDVHSKKWRVVLDASLGLSPFCVKRDGVLSQKSPAVPLRKVFNILAL